uniref:Uncharacterized protein n=1 Tax=Oryza punctata TaxID=4537 RepID=A0A0E0JGI0_ORYPU
MPRGGRGLQTTAIAAGNDAYDGGDGWQRRGRRQWSRLAATLLLVTPAGETPAMLQRHLLIIVVILHCVDTDRPRSKGTSSISPCRRRYGLPALSSPRLPIDLELLVSHLIKSTDTVLTGGDPLRSAHHERQRQAPARLT